MVPADPDFITCRGAGVTYLANHAQKREHFQDPVNGRARNLRRPLAYVGPDFVYCRVVLAQS